MTETKKRKIITIIILAELAILFLLGVLSIILKTFTLQVILHIYLKLLLVPLIIMFIKKLFRDQLNDSMNKALILSAIFIVLDLVVVDAFRFVLSKGISSILFLPMCLPICFIIIMLYSIKDMRRDNEEKRLIYIIGIPLLLLSLYFEIISFI